jgi:LuxR family maltose regulon positive regulatory protein
LPDAERHLRQGAVLAREIGRPYLEVGCLAQLGFASKIHPFATTQRRCREAIALAERYGWGAEPVIAPALVTLAGTMVWLGEFDEGERWLQRTARALQTDTGPDIRLLLHHTAGYCTPAAAATMRRSRSSARPNTCDRSSRDRTRWRAR